MMNREWEKVRSRVRQSCKEKDTDHKRQRDNDRYIEKELKQG